MEVLGREQVGPTRQPDTARQRDSLAALRPDRPGTIARGWRPTHLRSHGDSGRQLLGRERRGQLGDGTLSTAVAPFAGTRSTGRPDPHHGRGEPHLRTLSQRCGSLLGRKRVGSAGGRHLRPPRRRAAPTRGGVNAAEVSAGGRHTCAVTTGGEVECWGANDWGQLGSGTPTARSEPRRVRGLTGAAVDVTSGDNHTCALMSPGAVECWEQTTWASSAPARGR